MNRTQETSKAASGGHWTAPVAAAAFVAAYFGARLAMDAKGLGRTVHFLAALLPAPAFLFFLWSMARAIPRMDEMQRLIQLQALSLAWPLAVAIVMTISLLQKAGFLGWEPIWVYLPLTYFLGLALAHSRYR